MKALVLSVKAGFGHHSTGQAIIGALEKKGFECKMLDTLEQVNSHLATSVDEGYLFATKYLSDLYGKTYGILDKREEKYDKISLMALFAKLISKKLKDSITDYEPDVIIGTHSYACLLMTYLKEKGIINVPTFGVITDFTVHPFWESTDLDYYILPDSLLTQQAKKKGIAQEKILPFGIPIKEKFSEKMEKALARKELCINNRTTVLMVMGSMGFGNILDNLKLIDAIDEEFQVICVCGNNKKAKAEIDKTLFRHRVYAYGFVDNIDVMMDASDVIITKPGGLTTSELLAKGLPAILQDPIPGQEERNREFLVNSGAAVMVSPTFPIDEALYEVLGNPWRLELLKQSAKHLGKPDSAKKAADFIESKVKMKEKISV